MKNQQEKYLNLLQADVPPAKLGNKNKAGKCGMCGTKVKKLHPRRVGQVDFMICGNYKSIMEM